MQKVDFPYLESPPPHLHSFCCCQHFNHTSKPPNDFGSWRNAQTPQLEHLRWLLIKFIIITIWQVIQVLGHISNGNAVGCSADDDCGGNVCCNIAGPSWAKKPYHPESWPHTDYLLLLNLAKKSLWTVLFWQLNVAKLLSSFLGLFLWGGRDRKRRYFYENGYNWELTPFLYIYIKCNKEQKGEGRIG